MNTGEMVYFFRLFARKEAEPDTAAQLLMLAAYYLRNRKPMPDMLADYLADAFETAMVKPQENRVPQLGRELNLTALNRRPLYVSWGTLDIVVKKLLNEGMSQSQAEKEAAKFCGVSTSTAKRELAKRDAVIKKLDEAPESDPDFELFKRQVDVIYELEKAEIEKAIKTTKPRKQP